MFEAEKLHAQDQIRHWKAVYNGYLEKEALLAALGTSGLDGTLKQECCRVIEADMQAVADAAIANEPRIEDAVAVIAERVEAQAAAELEAIALAVADAEMGIDTQPR
jgi:hypothetical protein